MLWEQQIEYATISDIGFRRHNNQDSFSVIICSEEATWNDLGHLFLVADGMGGHAVGELASQMATDTIPHAYFKLKDQDVPHAMQAAIEAANAAIHKRGMLNRDFNRMGTTCVALSLSSCGAYSAHVGDSRLYRIRDNRIDQLTFDHSLQWELIRQGKLKPDEAFLHESRHIITRSLGPEPRVEVEIEGPFEVRSGDAYLLCSDGLTGHVEDEEIGIIAQCLPTGEACRLLKNLANLRGGSDNITVIIARVGEVMADAATPEQSKDQGLSWSALASTTGALLVVSAIALLIFLNRWFEASIAIAAVVGVAIIGIWFWMLKRRRGAAAESSATRAFATKVHQTAPAKLTRKFLNAIAQLESKLQKAAIEEGWSLNWKQHESRYEAAKEALDKKHATRALYEYSKAIDILMLGVHSYRKQLMEKARQEKQEAEQAAEAKQADEAEQHDEDADTNGSES